MNTQQTIHHIQQEMELFFSTEASGHGYDHILRVWKNAKTIAAAYPQANLFHIEVAALLHDWYDRKLVPNVTFARQEVITLLSSYGLEDSFIQKILYTIDAVSYKNGTNPIQPQSLEDKIVQDADRLDAIGAIGIARTFMYSAAHHRPMYSVPGEDTALQHFYDKLLLIADTMHTEKARELAFQRKAFMELFLQEFHAEWDGKR